MADPHIGLKIEGDRVSGIDAAGPRDTSAIGCADEGQALQRSAEIEKRYVGILGDANAGLPYDHRDANIRLDCLRLCAGAPDVLERARALYAFVIGDNKRSPDP